VLETICLDKETSHMKTQLAVKFAELVYNGQWFTPLREALSAFTDKTQETVTGKVKLKLYKGNIINAGVWSEYSLYSESLASFGESDYKQAEAEGFINLFGLPIQTKALLDEQRKK
jgi:argininosuccinate synthase